MLSPLSKATVSVLSSMQSANICTEISKSIFSLLALKLSRCRKGRGNIKKPLKSSPCPYKKVRRCICTANNKKICFGIHQHEIFSIFCIVKSYWSVSVLHCRRHKELNLYWGSLPFPNKLFLIYNSCSYGNGCFYFPELLAGMVYAHNIKV